jgi:DNA-binding SARP family transcriptional activator
VAIPGGRPGQLLRLLALHPNGLSVDEVTEWFFPEAAPASGRQRLRQTLTRMRSTAGELAIREGDRLRLRPAWVDVDAFRTAADAVRTTRGPRAIQLAYAALAIRTGPLLPADRHAEWAAETRLQVESRYLELLDLIVADANQRGAVNEALTALTAAHDSDPGDQARTEQLAEQLLRVGRPEAANYLSGAADRS